ncbi:hypothetical protein BD410DRAFT_38645 [Rickenella mellea]|uniref:Bromo domain-containing protein n=1 Tax=Rickenella mellea TaxID=50990 RepID=A0A4V3AZN0_9AGAM|nr:hypothetical protein BD410DRAFT_38645 [Rickenella mellea]
MAVNRVTRGSTAVAEDVASLTTRERLIFAQAVFEYGSKAWAEVTKVLSRHPLISRPRNFFSPLTCSSIYAQLMKASELDISERNDTPRSPVNLKLAQRYYRDRVLELRDQIAAEEARFRQLVSEIDDIRSGQLNKSTTGHDDDTSLLPADAPDVLASSQASSDEKQGPVNDEAVVEEEQVLDKADDQPEIIITQDDSELPLVIEQDVDESAVELPNADTPTKVDESIDQQNSPIHESLLEVPKEDATVEEPIEDEVVEDEAVEDVSLPQPVSVPSPEEVDEPSAATPAMDESLPGVTEEVAVEEVAVADDDMHVDVENDIEEVDVDVKEEVEEEVSRRSPALSSRQVRTRNQRRQQEEAQATPEPSPREKPRSRTSQKPRSKDSRKPKSTGSVNMEPATVIQEQESPQMDAEAKEEDGADSPGSQKHVSLMDENDDDERTPGPSTNRDQKRKVSDMEGSSFDSSRDRKRPREVSEPTDDAESPATSSAVASGPKSLKERKRFQSVIYMLHSQISQHRNGNIFHNPIKKSEAADYYDIVKRPMDLKTIKARVKDGLINNSTEFQRDIYLMFANSMMYNRPHSDIFNMAEEMMLESEAQINSFRQTEGYARTRL